MTDLRRYGQSSTSVNPAIVDSEHEAQTMAGQSKKVHLVCCLNCRSELWGYPEKCPYCLRPLPPRR
ncbi:MAG: hypothetical protein QOF01_4328 [Thermomicrobiales bacterium]|nr:hypothetical protein [Thermomicrobiales bacterium]